MLVGTLGLLGGIVILLRFADPTALILILLGFSALAVAFASTVWWPYHVVWISERLVLVFLFRTERLAATDIIWYQKRGVTWRPTTTAEQLNADVFVVLRYREPHRSRLSVAFLSLIGTGPAFSRRAAEYDTLLDRHIPDKERR
jgi:hypothetical protein